MLDVETLKDIPSYKAVLKLVLKSQIQFLIEQLSDNAGEDCVVLTANASEGSRCHFGSKKGKKFIQENSDIESKFLGYCLKGSDEESLTRSSPQSQPRHSTSSYKQFHELNDNNRKRKRSETQKDDRKMSELVARDTASKDIVAADRDIPEDTFMYQHASVSDLRNQRVAHEEEQRSLSDDDCIKSAVIKIETDVSEDDSPQMSSTDGMLSHFNNTEGSLSYSDVEAWYAPNKTEAELNSAHHVDMLPNISTIVTHSDGLGETTCDRSPQSPYRLRHENGKLPGNSDDTSQQFYDDAAMTDRRGHKCDVCSRVFNRKYNMLQHRQLHFGIKQFTCKVCKKAFTRQDRLRSHYLRHHSGLLSLGTP